jgi:Zn-dependent protease
MIKLSILRPRSGRRIDKKRMLFQLLQTSLPLALIMIGALVLTITIHEFAHALAGYLQGDMTARDAGRLTLNPLSHLDPIGSLMLLFVGFGWGKPTPYNPYHLKYHKWGPLLVALAGPASNLIGAVVSIGLLMILRPYYAPDNLLIVFLIYLFFTNVMLMIFNLLPIPPLDGSQILITALPDRFNPFKAFLLNNGPYILLTLILIENFTSIRIFSGLFDYFIGIMSRLLG